MPKGKSKFADPRRTIINIELSCIPVLTYLAPTNGYVSCTAVMLQEKCQIRQLSL